MFTINKKILSKNLKQIKTVSAFKEHPLTSHKNDKWITLQDAL